MTEEKTNLMQQLVKTAQARADAGLPTWEYHVEGKDAVSLDRLNTLGSQGYEAFYITDGRTYFKRVRL